MELISHKRFASYK